MDRYRAFVIRAAVEGAITNMTVNSEPSHHTVGIEMVLTEEQFQRVWKDALTMSDQDDE